MERGPPWIMLIAPHPAVASRHISIMRAYCRYYDNLVPFMDISAYSASRKGIAPMPARERRFIAIALLQNE
ncbi:protein of unknown function [Methylococcus capsulatus]|uniref:Uncharacterized protein n=1 Tax=Methylococcus capsulatus TaxID=414 RepID=A0AA35UV45_METCP|nr:protein of unknown function [Methylococcus capsulatus]